MVIGVMKITDEIFNDVEVKSRRAEGSPKTRCPNCDSTIGVGKPRVGAVIECRKCRAELEIISAAPFTVDFTGDWQSECQEELGSR